MNSASLVKVVAAFVCGLVVALGSALIYVRVADQRHAPPMPPPIPSASAEPKALSQASTETAVQEPAPENVSPVEAAQPEQAKPQPVPSRRVARRVVVPPAHKPVQKPVQMARVESQQHVYVPPADTVIPPLPTQTASQEQDQSSDATSEPGPEPSAPVPTPAPQPHVVTLAAGTLVSVRLGETLSTDHNYTGDTFRATLLSPIVQDGFIIADRGSKVLGRVVNAQSAGHMAAVSGLALALTEINTTDGQRVRIETTTFERSGPSTLGADTAKIAGGAALGALIGGLAGGGKGAAIGAGAGGAAGTGAVLWTHGKATVLASETQISFRLANPVTITEKLN